MIYSQTSSESCGLCAGIKAIGPIPARVGTADTAYCAICNCIWRNRGDGWYIPDVFEITRLQNMKRIP
ncbi:hypothetical protein TIN4_39 [Tsukamurella phage TIN4]|uniref:Uncharacterized protein n=2 Tax=Tinduovirus TIN3 TaxID=1982571 RepID=A0A0K0N5F9_9CAUD|nr:hypothetical protein AVT54_gp086 [Tsukamurella phage TIN3]YP_009604169.1 hypothetical protein FDH87_gp086 [Tsukamurella phage TIN4]AKJ71836.1 hypothetical protein TIN3_39 [Tsukamurella phage TIN3]AKJ71945.1 hypothetical protein TIN4_39 [Tsukamurella phage TIN4]